MCQCFLQANSIRRSGLNDILTEEPGGVKIMAMASSSQEDDFSDFCER